jgi:glutamine amidotransferase
MSKQRIAIANIGIGNSKSVFNALYSLGVNSEVIDDGSELSKFSHLILPGVGAFDHAVALLHEKSFFEELLIFHKAGNPILGICLGMQLLFSSSDEGERKGLDLIAGNVSRLEPTDNIHVPNTGWHDVTVTRGNTILKSGSTMRMYHNHAYAFQDPTAKDVTAVIKSEPNIVVGVENDGVFGLQFHPEKSHQSGIDVLKSFSES